MPVAPDQVQCYNNAIVILPYSAEAKPEHYSLSVFFEIMETRSTGM